MLQHPNHPEHTARVGAQLLAVTLQGEHLEQSRKVSDWCIDTGLVYQLTECLLVVLGLRVDAYAAQGRAADGPLSDMVYAAMRSAFMLQGTMLTL
jgi:hypothetical protein